MATNPYFESSFTAQAEDQSLYEDLIIESIQIHGRDYYYLPRTMQNFDSFFGEDTTSAFKSATTVEMYLESISGWEGEQDFISKFGMEVRDEATLILSRKRFAETIGKEYKLQNPREGDIIVFPYEVDMGHRAFEITWVDDEPTFYQIGKISTYRIKVRSFEYSGEDFDTGIKEIDQYNKYQFSQKIQLASGGKGSFQIGEIIKQGNTFEALVISTDTIEQTLVVSANISKEAQEANPQLRNFPIIGQDSGAAWFVDSMKDDAHHMTNADNDILEEKLDDILVVDDINPFSGHGY